MRNQQGFSGAAPCKVRQRSTARPSMPQCRTTTPWGGVYGAARHPYAVPHLKF